MLIARQLYPETSGSEIARSSFTPAFFFDAPVS
jgi:hypothetical protein